MPIIIPSHTTVMVVFDGFLNLHPNWKGRMNYPPLEKRAIHMLEDLDLKGVVLHLLTHRDPGTVRLWLKREGMDDYFESISSELLPCHCIIGASAITFDGDYEGAADRVLNFQPWWWTEEDEAAAGKKLQEIAELRGSTGRFRTREENR